MTKYAKHHFRTKRPFFVWGPPGIGKSDTMEGIKNSYIVDGKTAKLIDCRLSLWDTTDIKGFPYYDAGANKMRFSPPEEFPDAKEAADYGNRDSDKGVSYRMPKPLANRFLHYEVRSDFNTWFDWAVNNNVHPDVVGYLTTFKEDLYDFDASSAERSFATPRSWVFVSDTIRDVDGFNEEEVTDMVAAGIGEGKALKFKAHRQIAGTLPNPSDILSGKVTQLKTDNISAKYSLSTALCYELKEAYLNEDKNLNSMFDNFMRFIMDNFETEMVVMAASIALGKYKIRVKFSDLINWKEFIKTYGALIEEA